MRKNKSVLWLAGAAAVLLVLAYLLSRTSAEAPKGDGGPEPVGTKKHASVVYPRDQRGTPAALARKSAAAAPERRPALDAMQRALLADDKGAIFVEANAIRHSPLVEKVLRCRQSEGFTGFDDMKKNLGIDPTEDIDRVGLGSGVVVSTGFFDKMKVPPALGDGDAYGKKGRIWNATDDKGQKIYFAKDGNDMLVSGTDESQVKAAVDRAEGTAAEPSTSLPPGFGEGEVYGTVGKDFIQSVLAGSQDPMAQKLAELVTSSTVRMNVTEDAAMSLDLQAVDDKSAQDLSQALGGVFAGLHAKAESDGDTDLAQLLEQARVSPQDGGRFNVDVAVPGETLLHALGCRPDGTPDPALQEARMARIPKGAPAAAPPAH